MEEVKVSNGTLLKTRGGLEERRRKRSGWGLKLPAGHQFLLWGCNFWLVIRQNTSEGLLRYLWGGFKLVGVSF